MPRSTRPDRRRPRGPRDPDGDHRLRRHPQGDLPCVPSRHRCRRLRHRARRLRHLEDRRGIGPRDAGDVPGTRGPRRRTRRRMPKAGPRREVSRRVQRPGGRPAALRRDRADHHPTVGDHGGLRRPDPRDHPQRDRPAAARGDRADPRPRLPGVRHPGRRDRQGARHRVAARRDLLLVRRHAPRAGNRPRPVPGEERGRRRPGRLLAARRRQARRGAPRPPGRLLRDRLRDDRAGQRDGGPPGTPPRPHQLLGAGQPRARAAGDRGDRQLADQPRRRVPRRRSRVLGHGHPPVRPARRASSACRSW